MLYTYIGKTSPLQLLCRSKAVDRVYCFVYKRVPVRNE